NFKQSVRPLECLMQLTHLTITRYFCQSLLNLVRTNINLTLIAPIDMMSYHSPCNLKHLIALGALTLPAINLENPLELSSSGTINLNLSNCCFNLNSLEANIVP